MAEIIEERLAQITQIDSGCHKPPNGEFHACAMEAVSYIAGEPWSDHPKCACPVIASFIRAWNDRLPDDERSTLLLPLIPRLVGTKGQKALEERRALMAADWLIRTHPPAWLRLAGLTKQADTLSSLPEITSMDQVPSMRGPIEAARKDAAAAWDAARDAAWDAAWAAARDAAWDAAWAAARDAARDAVGAAAWDAARAAVGAAVGDAARAAARDAAWDAAWDAVGDAVGAAAWDAAWAAARDAAWDAARAALSDTKKELQQSAFALVERMIAADEPKAKAA